MVSDLFRLRLHQSDLVKGRVLAVGRRQEVLAEAGSAHELGALGLQLALDPDHASAAVVPCHLQDQGNQVGIERWSSGPPMTDVHLRATSSRCQRRIVEGVTMNPDQRTLGTILERAAICSVPSSDRRPA
jgi:hypothetical protein